MDQIGEPLQWCGFIGYLPECVLEADQRQVFDLDHLTLLLQLAEEHALEHRTAQGKNLFVAVDRVAIDEEANVAQSRIVEQRLVSIMPGECRRNVHCLHFVDAECGFTGTIDKVV